MLVCCSCLPLLSVAHAPPLPHCALLSIGVAGMLLCAILSDTLNLMGPTTTDWDRMMVAVLCQIAQVKDINALVKAQFKAKSKELESEWQP